MIIHGLPAAAAPAHLLPWHGASFSGGNLHSQRQRHQPACKAVPVATCTLPCLHGTLLHEAGRAGREQITSGGISSAQCQLLVMTIQNGNKPRHGGTISRARRPSFCTKLHKKLATSQLQFFTLISRECESGCQCLRLFPNYQLQHPDQTSWLETELLSLQVTKALVLPRMKNSIP